MIPLYKNSRKYALDHDEKEECLLSFRANVECKNMIEHYIRENYYENSLHGTTVEIEKEFGKSRYHLVVAATITQSSYDGRYSRYNIAWAKEVCDSVDVTIWNDYRLHLNNHPGLIDLLATRIRKEVRNQ